MSVFVWMGLAIIAIVGWLWQRRHERQGLAQMDRMLDALLENHTVDVSDLNDHALSALAHKVRQIQGCRSSDVETAEHEKEAVKGLVSNLSHQLKTPLSNVMLYQELLTDETLSPMQRTAFLKKQRQQLEKIDWVMQSLLKMVQLEQDVIEFEAMPLPIEATITEAVNAVYAKALAKDIAIVLTPFEDCSLWHHKKWTAEVFTNILENAVKYTSCGGEIKIHVRPLEIYTEIQFVDNGMGIRADEQTEIFKRFYRSSDAEGQEGAGIGLYLARLILEKEKGMLTVQPNPCGGSIFSVFLQNCHKEGMALQDD